MDSPDSDTWPRIWTRVTPDHYYNTDIIKSPTSSPVDIGREPFPFMRLPVEIRLQVYRIYLADRYTLSATEIHEMVLDSRHRTKSSAEILRVSKTVNAEVRDVLRREKTITLRICWQDATLDGFAVSCLRSRGMMHLDYDRIAHLRVEIYPRHVDRPTDMVRIWKSVQSLCSDLQGASCVQKLSLHFMENEYAAWSIYGSPLETFESLDFMEWKYAMWLVCDGPGPRFDPIWDTDRKPWDILHVLNLFKLLKNEKNAQIHLPLSVTENVRLQEARKDTEQMMMQTTSLDDRHQKSVIDTIEKAIADKELFFKYATGSCAQERLDRLCGEGCFILKDDLDIFEKVWPHRDCAEEEYRPRSQYIGFEDMEGEMRWDDIEPYDSDFEDF